MCKVESSAAGSKRDQNLFTISLATPYSSNKMLAATVDHLVPYTAYRCAGPMASNQQRSATAASCSRRCCNVRGAGPSPTAHKVSVDGCVSKHVSLIDACMHMRPQNAKSWRGRRGTSASACQHPRQNPRRLLERGPSRGSGRSS